MSRTSKIFQFAGVGLAILGIVLSMVFDEVIIVNFDLNEISKIELSNSMFQTNGVLINNFRDGVIFPDDKLTFKTSVINQYELPVEYSGFVTLLHKGQPIQEKITFIPRNLTANGGWTAYQAEFFAGDEGTNELEITFTATDPETRRVMLTDSFKLDLEILSLSDKIQSDQTTTLLIGVIASSVIGGITATALILNQKTAKKEIQHLEKQNVLSNKQNEFLQKQNQNIQEQFKSINRPWVVLGKNSGMVGDNQVDFFLENLGNLPAEKIVIKYKPVFYKENEKYTPPKSEEEIVNVGIIMPKQKHRFTFYTLLIDDIIHHDEINIDIFVTYYFGNEKKISTYNYYILKILDMDEITCKEAT